MQQTSLLVWYTGFICMFLIVIFNFYFIDKLLKKLRKQHPSVWEGLGSPTIFLNNSIKNGMATLRFIYKKEYAKVHDPSVSAICKKIFFIQIIGYVVFGCMFIFTFIVISASQH